MKPFNLNLKYMAFRMFVGGIEKRAYALFCTGEVICSFEIYVELHGDDDGFEWIYIQ